MTTIDLSDLESRLWSAADELRANSSLSPTEYRGPVLRLIFLAFAEHRFDQLRPELEAKATARRTVSAEDFWARGALFVPEPRVSFVRMNNSSRALPAEELDAYFADRWPDRA